MTFRYTHTGSFGHLDTTDAGDAVRYVIDRAASCVEGSREKSEARNERLASIVGFLLDKLAAKGTFNEDEMAEIFCYNVGVTET